MSTEKRPRIPEWITDRIEILRGTDSYEEYVRNALSRVVGQYWIVPDPQHPKRVRVMGADEEILGTNLARRQAEYIVQDLALVAEASTALSELGGNLEAADNPHLAAEVELMADRLVEISEQLSSAQPV